MYRCEETIIFPFPSQVAEIRLAADAYLEQYDVIAHIWVRGHVTLEGGERATIPDWHSVAELDEDLGVIGLGNLDLPEDQFVWILPSGPGEVRLTALEEEN